MLIVDKRNLMALPSVIAVKTTPEPETRQRNIEKHQSTINWVIAVNCKTKPRQRMV